MAEQVQRNFKYQSINCLSVVQSGGATGVGLMRGRLEWQASWLGRRYLSFVDDWKIMASLKTSVYAMCKEVATEFPGWSFSSGQFKKRAQEFCTLVIHAGFGFSPYSTPLQPAIFVNHKSSMALFKQVCGFEQPTSIVTFKEVANMLEHVPPELRRMCAIYADKELQLTIAPPSSNAVRQHIIDVAESRPVLRAVVEDGIQLIDKLYDMQTEESFLLNLPPRYTQSLQRYPYDEFEKSKGVMVCIVRALSGNFDFAYEYRKDSYPTEFPKRIKELDKLLELMPSLKEKYFRSGE